MAKFGSAADVLSQEQLFFAQTMFNWLQNTKKISITKIEQLKQYLTEEYSLEFRLQLAYLTEYKKADIQYIQRGNYDYSDEMFSELPHLLAMGIPPKGQEEIHAKVFTNILRDWVNAGQSLDIQGKGAQRPIELAMIKHNFAFINALKQNDYTFDTVDAFGFPPSVTLIGYIKRGAHTIEDLKKWIDTGFPINTTCLEQHGFKTALDLAKEYELVEVQELLKENGAVGSIVEFPEENALKDTLLAIELVDKQMNFKGNALEALRRYIGDFPVGYSSNAKMLQDKPLYTLDDFRKDFEKTANLLRFVDYVRTDKELNDSIADIFKPQVEKARKVFGSNPNLVPPTVTAGEAELLKKYFAKMSQYTKISQQAESIVIPSMSEVMAKTLIRSAAKEKAKIEKGEYHRINLHDDMYKTLLNYCVLNLDGSKADDVELFKGLLAKIGDFGVQYGWGDVDPGPDQPICMMSDMTPLAIAVSTGKNELALILAKHGYGVERWDCGKTIVHLAALQGNIKLLEMLKDFPKVKELCNTKDTEDSLPIIMPLVNGNKPLVKVLVELGANINWVDPKDGDTILHVLARHGLLDSLKLAKEFGADFSMKKDGLTIDQHVLQCAEEGVTQVTKDQIVEWFKGLDIRSAAVEKGDKPSEEAVIVDEKASLSKGGSNKDVLSSEEAKPDSGIDDISQLVAQFGSALQLQKSGNEEADHRSGQGEAVDSDSQIVEIVQLLTAVLSGGANAGGVAPQQQEVKVAGGGEEADQDGNPHGLNTDPLPNPWQE